MPGWEFEKNSVLNSPEKAECVEVFQGFCNELGRYFTGHGAKYAKSGPHISFSQNDVRLKICFWSSGSNMKGSYVNLEVIPSFFSRHVKEKKGYFWGHPEVFNTQKNTIKNNYNICEMPEEVFGVVTEMITYEILPIFDVLEDESKIAKYLDSLKPKYTKRRIIENRGLELFLKHMYPALHTNYYGN